MDVSEKLVELFYENNVRCDQKIEGLADDVVDIITNGVTVQDRKQLEAFLHPVDAYKGLKAKYIVFKADTGERVGNCFVLRPDKDPAAVEAIRAYARATDNETLAEDIYNWVGKGEPVQEWVSVKERLPENIANRVLVVCERSNGVFYAHYEKPFWINLETDKPFISTVTHWMPLPPAPEDMK